MTVIIFFCFCCCGLYILLGVVVPNEGFLLNLVKNIITGSNSGSELRFYTLFFIFIHCCLECCFYGIFEPVCYQELGLISIIISWRYQF